MVYVFLFEFEMFININNCFEEGNLIVGVSLLFNVCLVDINFIIFLIILIFLGLVNFKILFFILIVCVLWYLYVKYFYGKVCISLLKCCWFKVKFDIIIFIVDLLVNVFLVLMYGLMIFFKCGKRVRKLLCLLFIISCVNLVGFLVWFWFLCMFKYMLFLILYSGVLFLL